MRSDDIVHATANGSSTAAALSCALYVDVENLGSAAQAQDIVEHVLVNWSTECPLRAMPAPSGLALYVPANKVELWRIWASSKFPGIERSLRGVQHFTKDGSKNSADLAIVADAASDFAKGRVSHVAVISNDSDFGALFVKVRELAEDAAVQTPPFLWITSAGAGLSPELLQFIHPPLRWDVAVGLRPNAHKANVRDPNTDATIVAHIVNRLPIGTFKAADAQAAIKERWPKHPAASTPTQTGTWLRDKWPLLKEHGVLAGRTASPRTYEVTQETKKLASAKG